MKLQDFKNFQQFEKKLNSARSTNYVRFLGGEFKVFGGFVKEWRGSDLTQNEKSCPHCLLTLCKKIAEEYFRYKESPRGKAYLKSQENGEEGDGKEDDDAGTEG